MKIVFSLIFSFFLLIIKTITIFFDKYFIYINKNKKEIYMKCPFHLYNDVLIDLYIYISHINEDKNYSGDLEFF